LVKTIEEKNTTSEGSKFLPLNVWKRKGFNTHLIKKKGKHEVNRVLGDTYQVPIKTVQKEKVCNLARSQLLRMEQNMKRKRLSPRDKKNFDDDIDDVQAEGIQPKPSTKSSKSSSSSSSSSSSESNVKKKGKKNAKKARKRAKKQAKADKKAEQERKQRERSELRKHAQQERDRAKLTKKIHNDATRAATKMSSALFGLADLMRSPVFQVLPNLVQNKAQEAYNFVQEIDRECKKALKDKSPEPLTFTLEDVADRCKDALAVKNAATKMLSSLEGL